MGRVSVTSNNKELKIKTQNIKEFLLAIDSEELKNRGILRGALNLLQGASVDPLIDLMKECKTEKLIFPEIDWHIDIKHDFKNPFSSELKEGNTNELSNLGSVFFRTNIHINPFYKSNNSDSELGQENVDSEELTFGLEKDLQIALRNNIEKLEPDLKIIDNSKELVVESGRIDITAKDKIGKLVVIELKAGKAKPQSITQILSYMSSLKAKGKDQVRGILVSGGFDKQMVLAADMIQNLELIKYSINFSFTKS